ncbi:hypothetical protein DAPPUDRAFT_329246 [Daphnia pulex]|uniref:WHEP-TRS domain-containing protein n=1 Tax=Daphnia pulex TaxID=6669 RepID=E9HG23_DAPPU|nr:hypothetical protein DAPPUDRAFT_329246 [Daphnia pulex]|eukprot:EFX69315.1 hypothetical protein DAPPUDRAFT_329246 [Daphnia pulex]
MVFIYFPLYYRLLGDPELIKVRDLKANKADKTQIDTAVKELLALKSKFKLATVMEWKADSAIPSQVEKQDKDSTLNVDKLDAAIKACGDEVIYLKVKKADKVRYMEKERR